MTEVSKPAPGSVVRLKSGGPMMMVIDNSSFGDEVRCAWHMENGDFRCTDFPVKCLKIEVEEKP